MYGSYGRKNVFILSTLFMAITGIGQAIANSYIMFILFAYLNAVGTSAVFPLAFIIGERARFIPHSSDSIVKYNFEIIKSLATVAVST